jgi:uncharacterized protein (TIGR03083 family)
MNGARGVSCVLRSQMKNDYIKTVHLFPELNKYLLDLISEMEPEDWNAGTQFPNWRVKDILAHLLDTSIRRLSSQRDGFSPAVSAHISSYKDLVQYITEVADRWTSAFTGVSGTILTEMIERYQNELHEFLETLDPFGKAHFPVSWAGEEESFNWFDIAREYTERWHHQMQIREALNKEPIYSRALYHPVLDTFMQALPYHFKKHNQADGYTLGIEITGGAGGKWFLEWNNGIQALKYETGSEPQTMVRINQEIAWKIFTRWNNLDLSEGIEISGNPELGAHLLEMNCLMIS